MPVCLVVLTLPGLEGHVPILVGGMADTLPVFAVMLPSFLQKTSSLVGRLNSTLKARFIENQSVCGWCHFTTTVILQISIYVSTAI